MKKLPKYVSLHGACLVLENKKYFRDAGAWEVNFIIKKDRVFVNEPTGVMNHCHNVELVPCTEQEWKESNKGYV
jgi:hypothetical protein